MKIKVEKKGEKYLILFSDDETEVKGIFLNKADLRKLDSNIEEVLEYKNDKAGDDI
jgi:hypothetical protein